MNSSTKIHQSNELIISEHEKINLTSNEYICPACRSRETGDTLYSLSGFSMVRCRICQTQHLAPLPNDEGLRRIYNFNYYRDPCQQHGYKDYTANASLIKKTYLLRLKKIKSLLKSVSEVQSVHEIGCALGYGLEMAQKIFNAKISGSDISAEAVKACREKGLTCYTSNILGICEIIKSANTDLVYMFDIIEHLKNIPALLQWLSDITSPHALLALTTPDMESIYNRALGKRSPSIKIPQHVIYFTTRTLVQNLSDSFKLLKYFTDYQYFSIDIILERLKHVIGFNYKPINIFTDRAILIPTGMKLYVFQKNA